MSEEDEEVEQGDPIEGASYIVAYEADGLAGTVGDDEVLTVRLVYAESPEAMRRREGRIIKFWMFKADALLLAQQITEAAQLSRKKPSSAVN